MKAIDVIGRAGRSLRQAKARTILTSLAIGVGAFTITLALAAGEGGRQFATDLVASNADVTELYVQAVQDGQDMGSTGPIEYSDQPTINYGGGFSQKLLTADDVEYFESLGGVESVTPIYDVTAKYVTRAGEKKFIASLEPYNPSIKQDVLAGSMDDINDQSVAITDGYAKALGFSSPKDALGETVQIMLAKDSDGSEEELDLQVAAVTQNSIMSVSQGSSLVASRDTVAKAYQYIKEGTPFEHAFLGAIVKASNESFVANLKKTIESKDYTAQSAEDIMEFMFIFINVLMGVLIGFGALALLTSVFGIINTQYISVLERTQQIGLMKALGMSRRDVSRLFRYEAAWIGFLGGAIGAGLALVTGVVANPIISEALSIGDSRLLVFKPWFFVAVIGGVMLVAVVSGIMPARKAMRLDPIEALRTE